MAAPREISELVSRFTENLTASTSGAYNETQLRREEIAAVFVREAILRGAFGIRN